LHGHCKPSMTNIGKYSGKRNKILFPPGDGDKKLRHTPAAVVKYC
jgi:hypothetical protein